MMATNIWSQLGQRAPREPQEARPPAESTTEALRRRLEQGDATTEELRVHAGLATGRLVWGLLKADMWKGRVTRVGNCFHIDPDWDDRKDERAAITLLESLGYTVRPGGGGHTYRCWHCQFVATSDKEAIAHFGTTDGEVARCVEMRALEAAR